jgi:hypothetical protein
METLLAILLYMQLITSPAEYQKFYIDQLEIEHHYQIEQIKNDPALMMHINDVYLPRTADIIIICPDETKLNKKSSDFICKKSKNSADYMVYI